MNLISKGVEQSRHFNKNHFFISGTVKIKKANNFEHITHNLVQINPFIESHGHHQLIYIHLIFHTLHKKPSSVKSYTINKLLINPY